MTELPNPVDYVCKTSGLKRVDFIEYTRLRVEKEKAGSNPLPSNLEQKISTILSHLNRCAPCMSSYLRLLIEQTPLFLTKPTYFPS